jgi:hypothetical protein
VARPDHRIVEHDIEPHAWRDAISGWRAQVGRAEVAAAERGNIALLSNFGFAVGRDRVQPGFIEHILTGLSTTAAGGSQQESLDAWLLGKRSEANAGTVVDFVGERGTKISERVV